MSWLDTIREHPECLAFPALCAGRELGESAGELRDQTRGVFTDASGALGDVADRTGAAVERSVAPLERAMMWGAIGLIAISIMVVVGALIYFTFPIIWPLIVGR